VGIFGGRRAVRDSASEKQYPDELAEQAALEYGSGQFGAAMETYAKSIDKIHTMCVVANPNSRIRAPSSQDQPILDGFNNALGAAMASQPSFAPSATVQRTIIYLQQIAEQAGVESERYNQAIMEIETTFRLGQGQS